MKKSCSNYWEALVDIADGKSDPAAMAHVASCGSCGEKLALLQSFVSAGQLGFYDAPAEAIQSAKNLMPQAPRQFASLVRSTLALSGARSVAEDFQVVVSLGGAELRLMYTRVRNGWMIMGRLPEGDYQILDRSDVQLFPDRRFSFEVKNLAESEFTVEGGGQEFTVLPPEDLLKDESSSSR